MTKITFIFDNPVDEDQFEKVYSENLNALFAAIKNVVKHESSKVHPKEDGSATPAYRMVDLYFNSYADACDAVKTPEAQELFPAIFKACDGKVKILFSEIEG